MKSTISRMKKQVQQGFTLVEIAIVLVIIGLLIGGVLRGQELINSARVNSITSQQQSIQTAYYAFIDRYKFLPGDLTAAQAVSISYSTVPASSSGDGSITLIDSAAFFNNLTSASFLSCSPCTSVGTTGVIGTIGSGTTAATYNTIAGLNSGNTMVNVYGSPLTFLYDITNGTGGSTAGAIVFLSTSAEAPKPQVSTGGTLTSSMLAEIDRKVDDGNAASGQFRYTDLQATAAIAAGAPASGTFATATNSPKCATAAAGWVTNPASSTCQGASIF